MSGLSTMHIHISFRQGTSDVWASLNPILSAGEIGCETDTLREKRGDGKTTWLNLPYYLEEKAPMGLSATVITEDIDGNRQIEDRYIVHPISNVAGYLTRNPDGTLVWSTALTGGIETGYDGGDLDSPELPITPGYDGGYAEYV